MPLRLSHALVRGEVGDAAAEVEAELHAPAAHQGKAHEVTVAVGILIGVDSVATKILLYRVGPRLLYRVSIQL